MRKKYNKKRLKIPFKYRMGLVFFVLLLTVSGVLIYLNNVVNPVIIESSAAKTRSLSQKAVESAIYEVISDSIAYDRLITITRNDVGDVVLISTNSLQINMLARELVSVAQEKLEEIGSKGLEIPLGSFTGLPILVGRGPAVKIELLPIGNISCKFTSEMESAGINQTNHKIYLTINSNVSMILPTANQLVTTQTQIMIAENIIIGKIPETYLQSSTLDDMLNLIPW